jgi:hypothetical protein
VFCVHTGEPVAYASCAQRGCVFECMRILAVVSRPTPCRSTTNFREIP